MPASARTTVSGPGGSAAFTPSLAAMTALMILNRKSRSAVVSSAPLCNVRSNVRPAANAPAAPAGTVSVGRPAIAVRTRVTTTPSC